MAGYVVKSRFWDAARDAYVNPGADWTPADAEQAARLQKSGCIAPAVPGASKTVAPKPAAVTTIPGELAAKYRALAEKRTVKELQEILSDGDVEVPEGAKKGDLVELVVALTLRQEAAENAGGPPPAGG